MPFDIKIPIGKGIVGQVALTGEPKSLENAYDDPRFNQDFDKMTGYKTTTMLCMAVKDKFGNSLACL